MIKALSQTIKKQKDAFARFSPDAQRLLSLNLIYHLVLPIILIFVQAFLWGQTRDIKINLIYTLGSFGGNYVGYLMNGFLLRKYSIKVLFYIGMILSVLPMAVLVYTIDIQYSNIVWYGIVFGIGTGMYYSCRNFLSYLATDNENRTFFAGMEQFIIISGNFITPLIFGPIIIGLGEKYGWYDKQFIYQVGLAISLTVMFLTWILIRKSNFRSPELKKFFYLRFDKLWNYQRFLSLFIGLVETGFYMLMALLILNVVGEESALGLIESISTILSVFVVYVVSKKAKPEQRANILLAGAVSLTIGGLILGFEYSVIGVLGLKFFQIIADPLLHSSYRATWWSVIETVSKKEEKHGYAYMLDTEFFINVGRSLGGVILLLLITLGLTPDESLQYIFLILALMQFISFALLRYLNIKTLEPAENQTN
ncbi:MAG: hypothetical protein GVY19_00310 [Bacteroidetes bacterium]|jgi:YQGE family putative transporter|nr:hypothetical protein [Bacteroidota bacterium]